MVEFDRQAEPAILSKPTMDLFLRQNKPADLIALYLFYYYTAKWQKMNQIHCTTGYVAQGLKWGEDKVRATKQELIKLQLIKDEKAIDAFGKITGHYIRMFFIWTQAEAEQVLEAQRYDEANQPTENSVDGPILGKFQSMEKSEPNALRAVKEIEPSEVQKPRTTRSFPTIKTEVIQTKSTINQRNESFLPFAIQLAEIIKMKRRVTITTFQLNAWSEDIRKLSEQSQINPGRIKRALTWYSQNIGGEFVPVIESGSSLRFKFISLEAAIERDNPIKPLPKENKPELSDSDRAELLREQSRRILSEQNAMYSNN
jgi:hypothetical protein